jgi:hypothetical protein
MIRLPWTNSLPWSDAGVIGGIPNYSNGPSVMDFGAHADGVTSDTAAFASAPSSLSSLCNGYCSCWNLFHGFYS